MGRSSPSSLTTFTESPTRPMAPGGMSSERLTATPPSVAPKASITSTPKRREKSSTTWGEPSLPKAMRRELSASSGAAGVPSR